MGYNIKIFIFLFLLFSKSAFSYIPHSYFILEKMSENRPKVTKVLIQSQLRFFEAHSNKVVETFTEELEVDTAQNLIVLRIFDASQKLLFTRDLNLTQAEADLSPTLYLVFSKNSSNILYSLLKKGVPVVAENDLEKQAKEKDRRALEKLSLQRVDGQLSWVIGPKEKDRGSSLWVIKDLFRPLMLVYSDTKTTPQEVSEVHYMDYKPLGGMSYPTKIILKKNNFPFIALDVIGTKNITQTHPTRNTKWEYPSSQRAHFQAYIELLR